MNSDIKTANKYMKKYFDGRLQRNKCINHKVALLFYCIKQKK